MCRLTELPLRIRAVRNGLLSSEHVNGLLVRLEEVKKEILESADGHSEFIESFVRFMLILLAVPTSSAN